MAITIGHVLLDPSDDHLLVAWERSSLGHWLAMPIHRQTGPLHRAQLVISVPEVQALLGKDVKAVPLLVDTHIRRLVPDDARSVALCSTFLVHAIRSTLNRSLVAANSERSAPSQHGPGRGLF
jgi:hypothetical protein